MTVPAGMTSECAPVKGKLWTPVTAVLAALVMIMVGVLAVRFIRGIGAVTDLTAGYPWGLWIVWDVLLGSAALGVALPTMHQSSRGSMPLVYGRQIDPIYQTRARPILFLTSTVGMGLAAVTLEGTISSLGLGRPIESEMLSKLMKVCRVVIAAFLLIRFADLAIRGVLPQVVAPTTVALMFWIETALFVSSIALLGDSPSIRRVVTSAMAMALAGILYRIDAYLVAYHTGPGWHYFPSMGEIAVTVGLIAFEILAFIFAIRIIPVMQTK